MKFLLRWKLVSRFKIDITIEHMIYFISEIEMKTHLNYLQNKYGSYLQYIIYELQVREIGVSK